MLSRFEIVEDRSDIGIRAFGETLSELFENAALAVQFLALDPAKVEGTQSYVLEATGHHFESLFANWLNTIVFHLDAKGAAVAHIRVETITPTAVKARAWGELRDSGRHPQRLAIPAEAWHQPSIGIRDGQWVAEAYLPAQVIV